MKKLNEKELQEKIELLVYDKKMAEEMLKASDFLEFEYLDFMIRPINYKLKFGRSANSEIRIREASEKDLYALLMAPENVKVEGLKEEEVKKLLEIEFYWKERISQALKEHKQNHSLDEYRK